MPQNMFGVGLESALALLNPDPTFPKTPAGSTDPTSHSPSTSFVVVTGTTSDERRSELASELGLMIPERISVFRPLLGLDEASIGQALLNSGVPCVDLVRDAHPNEVAIHAVSAKQYTPRTSATDGSSSKLAATYSGQTVAKVWQVAPTVALGLSLE
jgi:hypothetical protein